MKKKIQEMFLSKRFVCFVLCLITFIVLSLTTDIDVVSSATGLSMLSIIYIGGESLRSSISKIKEEDKG
jgi:hypothetical protein